MELSESHVLLKLDTKNGTADFVEELGVKRNHSYVLLMKVDSYPDVRQDTVHHRAMEKVRLTDPESLDLIFELTRVTSESIK